MDGRTFYGLFVSFLAGVLAGSYFGVGIGLVFPILLFLGAAFATRCKYFLLLFFCAMFFLFGAYRLEISKDHYHPFDRSVGQEIEVLGRISAEPEIKELGQKFHFRLDDGRDKALVSAPHFPSYSYGDRLKITGTLKLPENFETYPKGPVFDYISYLEKDDVRYVMQDAEVLSHEGNEGNAIVSALIKIKRSFTENIRQNIPEPLSSLAVGILLGEKSSLPREVKDDFRRTGLSHILVLSGSNVSIVAASFMTFFSFLPRSLAQSFGVVSIVLFAVMTGASATTLRASIMALVLILAKRAGRNYDVSRALILAAFFMVVANPEILAFDIGFQLSFLSTLALALFLPVISGHLKWITERFQFRYILASTISTQIFLLPFLIYKMGEISLVSLLANILVLPTVPWTMFLSFASGLSDYLGRVFSILPSISADMLLSWMLLVTSRLSDLPLASIKTSISWPMMLSAYILFGVTIRRRRNSSPRSASLN